MICTTLFELACALINETPESIGNEAFDVTAPALINAYLLENNQLNLLLIGADDGDVPSINALTDVFPFDVRLAPPCVYYLSAGLVRDENSSVSDHMLDRVDLLTKRAAANITAELSSIPDIYSDID